MNYSIYSSQDRNIKLMKYLFTPHKRKNEVEQNSQEVTLCDLEEYCTLLSGSVISYYLWMWVLVIDIFKSQSAYL